MPTVIRPIMPCDPRSATIAEMLLITPKDRNGTVEPNTTSRAMLSPIRLIATVCTEAIVSVIVLNIYMFPFTVIAKYKSNLKPIRRILSFHYNVFSLYEK